MVEAVRRHRRMSSACRRVRGASATHATAVPPTSTPVPPTPTPDPAAPVKAWVDAINNGDAEAALALVSDDVKWQGFIRRNWEGAVARCG